VIRRVRINIKRGGGLLPTLNLSSCPKVTARLPLEGFSSSFILWVFMKIYQQNADFMKARKKISGTIHEQLYVFHISCSNIATKPNPFEIIPLQTTRKENNWKTEEALARAAGTLETERIKGSNPWYLWWWWIFVGKNYTESIVVLSCQGSQQLLYF